MRIVGSLLRKLRTVSGRPPQHHPALKVESFFSFADCQRQLEANGTEVHSRRLLEAKFAKELGKKRRATLPGECSVCRRKRNFIYDLKYSDGTHVNWRERLVCKRCGLNNRLRLCYQIIERMAPADAAVYLTEQVTPLARRLARKYRNLEQSEYLGADRASGSVNARGIRHQDVTALGFEDESFNFVLSFDVLEHVPNYRAALAEFRRVLKKDGKLILSVPFCLLEERTIIRSRLTSGGDVEHLLPPEYHGDPLDPNGGVLCYYHFGWELLDDIKAAGFRTAQLDAYWSLPYGHIGNEQLIVIATT